VRSVSFIAALPQDIFVLEVDATAISKKMFEVAAVARPRCRKRFTEVS